MILKKEKKNLKSRLKNMKLVIDPRNIPYLDQYNIWNLKLIPIQHDYLIIIESCVLKNNINKYKVYLNLGKWSLFSFEHQLLSSTKLSPSLLSDLWQLQQLLLTMHSYFELGETAWLSVRKLHLEL